MADPTIDFEAWQISPAGQYLMSWELARVDEAVIDSFGYYAFQMGLTQQPFLRANRMPYRRRAALANAQGLVPAAYPEAHLVLDPHFLPFPPNHLDLLVYPHTLERCHAPQQAIREAERVLVPDGRLVICGLNPYSLKAIGKRLLRAGRRPAAGDLSIQAARPVAIWRLKEWLNLLGFEIESVQVGGDRRPYLWGGKVWGRAYVVVANKKVPGMRLITAPWQKHSRIVAPLAQAARYTDPGKPKSENE